MSSTFARKLAHPVNTGVLTGVLIGVLGATCTLWVDSLVQVSSPIATGNARALLGGAFASVVTVGAFSFWMRPVAAQLAASTVPPRLLAGRLYDRFQRRVIAATVGVLGFLAVVVLSLPAASDASAPAGSTVVGGLLGVGAIASLLVAMRHAETSTRPSVVLADAASEVIRHIRLAALDEPVDHTGLPDGPPATVQAPSSGWVRDVDREGLLAATPGGATIRLEADVGTFVVAGWTTVVSVWARDGLDEDTHRRLASKLDIGRERGSPLDLVGALSEFVDVGVHAGAGSAASPSTVYESMWWLGAVLHELTRHHDIGFPDQRLDDGTVLVRENRMSTPQLAELAVDRIRQVTASHPAMALELVRVVLDVEHAADVRGRPELAGSLRRQAELVVEQCRRGGGLPSDVDRVAQALGGRQRSDAWGRANEYPTDDGELPTARRSERTSTRA